MSVTSEFNAYTHNPLIHRDRRLGHLGRLGNASSAWVRSFDCSSMRILIVCRGPIRKEALDVFREMGITQCGVLLSEKDSIVYPRALAPELRLLDPAHVHAVPDYTGATKEERVARVQQMIAIARTHGYDYVFAGYGFMAEDEDFVRAIEDAGLTFIGPCSHTVSSAGRKDEAKRTALEQEVSVTPGINNATTKTLLKKYPSREALQAVAKEHQLQLPENALNAEHASETLDALDTLDALAEAVLEASYDAGIDLYTMDELGAQIQEDAASMLAEYAGNRVRLKAIGGGGGKGQRILSDAADAPALVREVLNEVKATGVGDNKNILVELNIEQTRHNEIQLIGNGTWCISLGGRDCSLQMHEQKLLEVSVTQEALAETIARYQALADADADDADAAQKAEILKEDLAMLRRMEEEAERFGAAVKLDSASTFECIVDGNRHFFMEVNTRIQVEHRVSELCYALRFRNPHHGDGDGDGDGDGENKDNTDNADDYFDVHSLVECMALLACHKERLPRPDRVRREAAAVEARLNATDRSLSPHAGGEIVYWSDPIDAEIRDDQGICIKNPDTNLFMRYKLAGAYDSNVALLLTTGDDRQQSYEKLSEVLRCTSLRGPDLATNLEFHYGLVGWFLSQGVDAKPTTRFVVPYLTLVGQLKEAANQVDLNYAYDALTKQALAACADTDTNSDKTKQKAVSDVLALKRTLLVRPLLRLIEEPHLLSAWLSAHRLDFEIQTQTQTQGQHKKVVWKRNPIHVLANTYHLLHMDDQPGAPAAHRIWDHDQDIIDEANAFYAAFIEQAHAYGNNNPSASLKCLSWPELDALLSQDTPAYGFSADTWTQIGSAHRGFQLGLSILGLFPLIADNVGFFELAVQRDLSIHIPERLFNTEEQARVKKILVPPPATKADEIVAISGGMYYGQEAPGMPTFVTEGHHFDIGEPLYIIEVMKMFNKVYAPFAGTIDKVLLHDDGTIVSKGQPLFKITPDERIVEEDPNKARKRMQKNTDAYLKAL